MLSVAGGADISGNVGIGTTSPSRALEVQSSHDAEIGIKSSSANGRLWTLQSSDPADPGHGQSFQIIDRTAEASRVLIDTSGNVGIGTTSPGQKLHVAGNICATGTIGACSDARFKKNVMGLTDALDRVAQLRGVSFDWKREEFADHQFADGRQVGMIAQEVEKVLPEVVARGNDGYRSVDYGRLTPLIVEAVKQIRFEKDEQIGALRRENAELREMLKRVSERVDALEGGS
jgi:hypothetical protein